MAETQNQTPTTLVEQPEAEETLSRRQLFVNNHPRAVKVAAIVGGTTAVLGVVHFARTVRANKDHLDAAADHAKEALHEVAASTSPTDAEA